MAQQNIYQVDAFTSTLFGGNPAAVCPLESWLSDDLMQSIAAENNLPETAFIVSEADRYAIRWFTPNEEVVLCGHATLASAYVIYEILKRNSEQIIFNSKSGPLIVKKKNHLFEMDFPAAPFTKTTVSHDLLAAIGVHPTAVYESELNFLMIVDNEQQVKEAKLDLQAIKKLDHRGIILSAPSTTADIYSRCFYADCDIPEDPVTGSAHCMIAPYWCERLGKPKIHAIQGLKRQGELFCEVKGDRVLLSGACRLYFQGQLFLT